MSGGFNDMNWGERMPVIDCIRRIVTIFRLGEIQFSMKDHKTSPSISET
jgi:hypothetical protein